jgi:hypothetical protein
VADEDVALVTQYAETRPQVHRLACLVSLAVRVEPEYLRAARLALAPTLRPDAEAELWFSLLVESRSVRGFTLHPGVAEELQRQLVGDAEAEAAWQLRRRFHPYLHPAIVLEEEVRWLSLVRPEATGEIERALQPAVKAMASGEGRALAMARWAVRALPALPRAARDSEAAALLAIGTAARVPASVAFADRLTHARLPGGAARLLPEGDEVALGVRLTEGAILFVAPDQSSSGVLRLPRTQPLYVEIAWPDAGGRMAMVVANPESGARIPVPASVRLFVLATIDGRAYELAAAAPPAAPSAPPAAAPEPAYESDELRRLAEQLKMAQARKQALQRAGKNTQEVDREILELRRRLREGGQLRAGDELAQGRYLLLNLIGRGGFATVWAAYDATRSEQVVIKVLHANLAGDVVRRERFFRGARVMAALQHPYVVRVLEPQGEDGGFLYFVMELVEGEDLRRAVVAGRVRKEDAVTLILGVGEALAAAHAKGIVHRDVKPANILLDASRRPKLTDFDLVWAGDTTGGTRTGALGSFLFMAPEQMDRPGDADARADVYGLGMTTIFCLHGRELPATVMQRPDRVIGALPCADAVKQVLTRAIEWEPGDRYPDMAGFCEALREAVAQEGEGGEPNDTPGR